MAKVTITIEDAPASPGKDGLNMSIESDPPFNNQDADKNTPAQSIAGISVADEDEE